ncbi:Transcriptional coactivator [Mactra antiquata]
MASFNQVTKSKKRKLPQNPKQTSSKATKMNKDCNIFEEHLGKDIFVVVNTFQHESLIHIRKYDVDGDKIFPTKTGACLTLSRWKQFVIQLDEIDTSLKKSCNNEDVEYQFHLGGNWHVSVSRGYYCVDIRKFWLPENEKEIVPSRKGIDLGPSEFRELKRLTGSIEDQLPELAEIVPCMMREDPQNQLGALQCSECNPNDFQNW